MTETAPARVVGVGRSHREPVAVLAFANGDHLTIPTTWISDDTGKAVERGQHVEVEMHFRRGWRRLPEER